ncbi:zinc ABC transporter substrate-binding protein [Microbacterium hominis]|uniref:metal ABC transporter solute-binding protein, Zn/Mn family n=1 Tax=Microbacterium TaxID=33882 RepID=UPI00168B4594|nr:MULTISPECIES: zinc ABC transporter substrate-binding protein [Microbacterium]QOC27004.1 zinc ABC transporter substrate-binding protein [Microbacterium hominis]QOC28166.1 zinc ABC transporter substrate-binding protein [Microbacterium hominis]QYF96661.1 zinc ABC transporter substrate-binding protein [Microbacterium sp. PAMC21962]
MKRPVVLLAALTAASALALTGCSSSTGASSTPSASADGTIAVVASTNVYGDIAKTIGGEHVEVTALIADESKDPHEFEATAADQLDIQNAQLLIENGGGYDPFMATLKDAAKSDAPLISAVTFSPEWTGSDPSEAVDGFNEHVFYDPQTIAAVADEIAAQLGALDPAEASVFTANAKAFRADIDAKVTPILTEVAAAHTGTEIFVTEPVPLYLAEAAGLTNVTPAAFSEAVEEGQDVPPATLLDALTLVGGGSVKIVFVNAQAAGAETTQVETKAGEAGVPVIKASELLPEGENYVSWMTDMATQIKSALGS